jgi:hypothetical protein
MMSSRRLSSSLRAWRAGVVIEFLSIEFVP